MRTKKKENHITMSQCKPNNFCDIITSMRSILSRMYAIVITQTYTI